MARTLLRAVPIVALLAALGTAGYAADPPPVALNVQFDTGIWDPGTSTWTGGVFDSTTHPTLVGGTYDVTITGGSWTDPTMTGGYWEFNGGARFAVSGGGDSIIGTSDIVITVWADFVDPTQVDPFGMHTLELRNGTVTGGQVAGIGNKSGVGSFYSSPMSLEVLGVGSDGNPVLASLGSLGDGVVDGDYVPTPELPPGVLAFMGGPGLLWWRSRRRRKG